MTRERLKWSRTAGQRLLLGVNLVLVVGLVVGATAVALVTHKVSGIERLDVAGSLTSAVPPRTVIAGDIRPLSPVAAVAGQPSNTTAVPSGPPSVEENYLIVGSDNAERIDAGDPVLNEREDEVTNNLADTIIVLRLRPADGTASILSIPRDLEVTIAGTTRQQKINTAFNLPDSEKRAARLIDTIEQNLDISLQHFIEVDLAGFRRLVDALDGVAVCFDAPSRDAGTGLFIDRGGWAVLDGQQALQFVRSRKMQIRNLGGEWENASPRADLDRIVRQQTFVRVALSQALAELAARPPVLLSLLDIAADELSVSNTFNLIGDGADMARWFEGFTDETLETLSLDGHLVDLPVTEFRRDARLGLLPSAGRILDVFRGINLEDVVADRVEVTVEGPAELVDGLGSIGFVVSSRSSPDEPPDSTIILYGVGGSEAADLVAAFLEGPVVFSQSIDLKGNSIAVEAGRLARVRGAPRRLDTGAPPYVDTTTSSVAPTRPSIAPHNYEFDCSTDAAQRAMPARN